MNELIPFADIKQMAHAIGASKMFGQSPEQALALMLVAQAEGRHPAIVARDYHIIQGRPSLKADAMLARFQQEGGRVKWHALTDAIADATFSHAAGGEIRLSWTIEQAKKAGLTGKSGPWQQFPRAMLRARLISEGIRTVYPGVLVGTYTPEEVQDFDTTAQPQQPRQERDITPADTGTETIIESAPASESVSVAEAVAAVRSAHKRVGRAVIEALSAAGLPTNAQQLAERPDTAAAVLEVANGF